MNNVCIVGYGAVGPVHAMAVDDIEYSNLYAVCDIDKTKLDICKKRYNNIIMYSDFDEMLLDDKIDSVHICTPHYLHFEMVKKALQKGKDVVIEKPVTIQRDDFDELLEICKNSSNKVCVMFQNRTCNCIEELRKLSKQLGDIKGIYAALTWHRDMDYYNRDSWRGKLKTEGGGVLINQAIHLLDLVSYVGGEIVDVSATMSTKLLNIEVEDTVDCLMTLRNGTKACFYATNAYAVNSPYRLEIVFENETFKYENKTLYKLSSGGYEVIATDSMNYCGKDYWGSGHERVIKEFYNGGNYPTIFDAENTMKALFAIYDSAREGRKISI